MTSNTGHGGNSVLNSWESIVLSTCLELSGSATEDRPMCTIFCKFFPAFVSSFKMGLIIFIVKMSQELKVSVKRPDFMMAEIAWSTACHKAGIFQGQWKCLMSVESWVIYLILLRLWQSGKQPCTGLYQQYFYNIHFCASDWCPSGNLI